MTPQVLLQRRLKAEGRCVTCCQPHDTGKARCQGCQDKRNATRRQKRRQLIAEGRCQECWATLLGASAYTRCLDCRVKMAARAKRLRRAA